MRNTVDEIILKCPNNKLDCYEDWDDAPEDALIIELYKKEFGGFFRMPKEQVLYEFKNKENKKIKLNLCCEVKNIDGLTLLDDDKKTLRIKWDSLKKSLRQKRIYFSI